MYIREPVVSGMFYPDDPTVLKSDIDKYIKKVFKDKEFKKIPADHLKGLIVPHAGYVYSGPVAAYSYAQLIDSGTEVVIVLALSHRTRFSGATVIPNGSYKTPLGSVNIDTIIAEKLIKSDLFEFYPEVHEVEHSLEVQVPFLQYTLDEFKLVPILVGSSNIEECNLLAETIYRAIKDEKRDIKIVISTDLSHYHSYSKACSMDLVLTEVLAKNSEKALYDTIVSGKAEACGISPLLTGIPLLRKLGAKDFSLLKYANSGDTAGDKERVVGYLSAAFTG